MNLTKRRETILTVIAEQHEGLSKLQNGKTDYMLTTSRIYANSLINTLFDNKNGLAAELSKMRDAGLIENGNSEYENGIATLTWKITDAGRGMLLTSSNEGPRREIPIEPREKKQEPEQKTDTSPDNYEIRVMSLIIGLKKIQTYVESPIIASIEDEGGGEFVSLSQNDQKINFNTEEWNYIDQAVRRLIADCGLQGVTLN